MKKLHLSRELRRAAAAVLGVAGLVVGSVAAFATAAEAANEVATPVTFDCATVVGVNSNPFTWSATVTLSAYRPAGSTTVTLYAQMSDLPGISPVAMNGFEGTDELVLEIAGAPITLTGKGPVTAPAKQPIPLPELKGTVTSADATIAATAKSFKFVVSGIETSCTAPAGATLGSVTVNAGDRPTPTPAPTPTPTTTTSATATPTASASPTTSTGGKGKSKGTPAKGTVTFACTLNIGSTFDWKPTVTVSGSREKASDPVSLVATMTDLPGIAPVPIAGSMDFTLDVAVGGAKTTLKSTGTIDAAPNEEVPVTDLSGSVKAKGDELDVAVSAFSFDFPSGGVGAECKASKSALSAMKVGSEPVAVDDSDSGSGAGSGSGSGSSSGSGSLPQTGGGDALPVIALWAIALSLLGAALLLIVPGAVRKKA